MSSLRTTYIPKDVADAIFGPMEGDDVNDKGFTQQVKEWAEETTGRQTVTIQTAHGDPVTVNLDDMKADPEVRRQMGQVVRNAVVAGAIEHSGEPASEAEDDSERFRLPPPPIGEYMHAPDLRELYDRLFDEYEGNPLVDQLAWHVEDVDIRFCWKQKGGKSQGRAVLGKCVKLSGPARFFAKDADFMIWFAWDNLAALRITEHQAMALMFHELSHIEKLVDDETGEIAYAIKGHEIEAFNAEIAVFGAWKSDLTQAAETFQQLTLDVEA